MVKAYKNIMPDVKRAAFVADSADIMGNVTLGSGASVWYSAVLRGDSGRIIVGRNSNIQDNCTVHCTAGGYNVAIGENVTVGHNAVVHGCTIGDNCLIGMGAIILNGAVIEKNCLVGAGALVTENKHFPENSLIIGSPARAVKQLTDDDVKGIIGNAAEYVKLAQNHKEEKGMLPL